MPIQEQALDFRRKLIEGGIEAEAVRIRRQLQRALQNCRTRAGAKPAIEERPRPVHDDFRGVEVELRAQAIARGARAVRRIEAERSRLELRHGNAAFWASQFLGKDVLLAADDRNRHQALRQLQCRRAGLLQPRRDSRLDEQAIHNHLDRVILPLVQDRRIIERVEFAIDARADIAVLRQLFQLFAVRAFPPARYRRQDHDAVVGLAQLAVQDGLDELLARLPGDGSAATRAMRQSHRTVDHAEIVVDLGDRAHRRARRAGRGFLLDGDGRREAFYHVHVRAFHLVQELPGVRGERLHVAALAFGVNGVKRERRLSRAGKPGDHSQAVARDVEIEVLQVVLARPSDNQFGQAHKARALPPQEALAHSGYTAPRITLQGSKRAPQGQGYTHAVDVRKGPQWGEHMLANFHGVGRFYLLSIGKQQKNMALWLAPIVQSTG